MRPDEIAAESEVERGKSFDRAIGGTAKTLLKGGAAAGAIGLGAKVAPFLSSYIPVDLAIKGINKISPKLGDFLKKGMDSGLDIKEGLKFIKDKLNAPQEPAKQSRNIIEQYSPELHQYIQGEIQKGRSPLEAGALASLQHNYKKVIKNLATDHNTSFDAILESVYGSSKAESKAPLQLGSTDQNQMQSQAPQGQGGAGQQALMAILQKIQQSRGGR